MRPDREISLWLTGISVGLISAAIVAYQLALMQVLSYVQWYHFAYMIISIALLGFGAAGTFLTFFKQWLLERFSLAFPVLSIVTGLLMAIVVPVSGWESIRFDSFLFFNDIRYTGRLLSTYLVFFLPFFTGALAIGLSFIRYAEQISKIYFANLTGSGAGGILALVLMYFLLPGKLPASISVLAIIAGLITIYNTGWKIKAIVGISITVVIFALFNPAELKPSEYKDLSKVLLLPDTKIIHERNSPQGLVQVVKSPVIRYAPGVSLSFRNTFPVHEVVFNNGNWAGFRVNSPLLSDTNMLDYTPQSLAYSIDTLGTVLILNAGTGENISLALSHKVNKIYATEKHGEIFRILQESFDGCNNLTLHKGSGRTYLNADSSKYNLIQLPVIGSFFGNSGLNAVATRNDLTIEAFGKMWERLTENGMISVSCWMDHPNRNPFRILNTITRMLNKENIDSPEKHIIAIRSWSAVSFLVSKSEFDNQQIECVERFCSEMMFDPLILAGYEIENKERFNFLQDTSFYANIEMIVSGHENSMIRNYQFRIGPVTDNRPFFFQNLRWKGIPRILAMIGDSSFPYFELGYLLVLITFLQIIVVAAFFIILPLGFKRWKSTGKGWVFVYFSSIGLAYMFVEIVFIHEFTFYFGHPVFATAASVSILLIASALGSYYSGSFQNTKKQLTVFSFGIALLVMVLTFLLPGILSISMGLSFVLKIIIALFLIGVPGFFMGMPFPAGIKHLADKRQDDIPWAWAFNGYFSVISTALATIISVESGFSSVLFLAALLYGIVAAINQLVKVD